MRHVGSVTRPGIGPVAPALRVWRLNHWTTREVSEAKFTGCFQPATHSQNTRRAVKKLSLHIVWRSSNTISSHFTDEETEAQDGQTLVQLGSGTDSSQSILRQSWALNHAASPPRIQRHEQVLICRSGSILGLWVPHQNTYPCCILSIWVLGWPPPLPQASWEVVSDGPGSNSGLALASQMIPSP